MICALAVTAALGFSAGTVRADRRAVTDAVALSLTVNLPFGHHTRRAAAFVEGVCIDGALKWKAYRVSLPLLRVARLLCARAVCFPSVGRSRTAARRLLYGSSVLRGASNTLGHPSCRAPMRAALMPRAHVTPTSPRARSWQLSRPCQKMSWRDARRSRRRRPALTPRCSNSSVSSARRSAQPERAGQAGLGSVPAAAARKVALSTAMMGRVAALSVR